MITSIFENAKTIDSINVATLGSGTNDSAGVP
jgi:hypothetical protein